VTTSGSSGPASFRRALRRAAPGLARDLPWINHGDPWAVLVSEFMLQQTSVTRVREPWRRFLTRFPTAASCADAALAEVMRHWEGLGYHRRAKALHDSATMIRDRFGGQVPNDVERLRQLPGVGEYTAHAVASFAFARRVAVLDTNVGRVLARAVANRPLGHREAATMAQELLPTRDSARFNQAMIDLGAQYCRARPHCDTCPVARSCRWNLEGGIDPAPRSAAVSRPQAPFAGSDRQLRGRLLAELRCGPRSCATLHERLAMEPAKGEHLLAQLVRDGLVERRAGLVQLVGDHTSPGR
jgi:A/G-specific adenine glycosylase